MTKAEISNIEEFEGLETAWIEAKNLAIEKQELMALKIKTYLGGMGPAPSRHEQDVLNEVWHHESQERERLNQFVTELLV